jgi:cysteine synthase
MMVYKNLLETIGNTPMVELKHYSKNPNVRIYAKLEGTNPGGSIKDRVAWQMMRGLKIGPERILIEPTSGNTGMGMAMIAAMMGYKFTAVMKRTVSVEKIKLLKAYGAEVVLTDDSIEQVRVMAAENKRYLWLNQYENMANVTAHYLGTGFEIARDVPEVTHFVAGLGTGGTIMGVGKKLKELNPKAQIIGLEPKPGTKIQGLRNMEEYMPKILDLKKLDRVIRVEDEAAFDLAKDLFKREGLSVGISSGANLWGAIEMSKSVVSGVIVAVFPDRGDKYISTQLFE